MERQPDGIVELSGTSSYGKQLPERLHPESLPDEILGRNPVELQEVYFSSKGKGQHTSYSYRPTTNIAFKAGDSAGTIVNKLHRHDYFEIMLIASGCVEMQIETQLCSFEHWDICILNRSTKHAEHFKNDCKIFYLALAPEYLLNWPREDGMAFMNSLPFTHFFNKGLRGSAHQNKDYAAAKYINPHRPSPVGKIVEAIRCELEDKQPGYQLMVRSLVYRFFSILANTAQYTLRHVDLGRDDGSSLALSAKQILDNTKQRVTKKLLAEKLNYNSDYINRVFTRHYGCSVTAYNQIVCVRHAAHLLTNESLKIHEICHQLGYTNRTHFYALFQKEYGCTPHEYRKNALAANRFT